ncbi:solute carrier family 22 member 7-like [Pygocentrus nattereri]|uniref:solute carrier family 22 member 7-like n=1 Tax=Pygocentrus nattereri TaxID=42514 RepID=UPI0008142096|nr:solute carrier family 22 member 7-like [Pygocentrus nattereri]
MKFEDILSEINGFGTFQKTLLLNNFIGRFGLACHFILNIFINVIPSHHCDFNALDADGVFGNLTYEQRLTVSIPQREDGTFDSCLMFSEPQFDLLKNMSSPTEPPVVPCQNGWIYDNSTFTSSLATQWDLVCEKAGMNKAVVTIFFLGVMFGATMFGSLSATFGRKKMLLVSYISAMGFALVSVFSSSFTMFAVLRFFTGLSITGIVIISTILNVEWVDIEHRKLVGVIDSMSWSFATMCFCPIAYWIREWRWLTVAVTLPISISIISWWWIPESARWLIANGKVEEAHYYLRKCAIMNRREEFISHIKPEVLSSIVGTDGENRKYSYLDLVRTPKMRRLALMTGLTWFCVATVAYGIGFSIGSLGLNLYLTQFVYGAIEIPSKLGVYYLLDRIGRRTTVVGALLLAGFSLMINIFIPKDQTVVRTVIAVLGRGFSGASFMTTILYSSELYPTVLRQNGMGYNSFLARLGVSVAPLILLLDDVWGHLSQVILCSVALFAGLVAYQLPETRNRCLPETIEDIEGTKQKLSDIISE